jgi:hypothetical protein
MLLKQLRLGTVEASKNYVAFIPLNGFGRVAASTPERLRRQLLARGYDSVDADAVHGAASVLLIDLKQQKVGSK